MSRDPAASPVMTAGLREHLARRAERAGPPRPLAAFGPGAAERLVAVADVAPALDLIAALPADDDTAAALAALGERRSRVGNGELMDVLDAEGLQLDQVTVLAQPGAARAFLLAAAERGMFPRKDGLALWRADGEVQDAIACELERRDYAVRRAVDEDLAVLRRLEEECWRPEIRSGEAELLQRIANHPDGQLALTVAGEVAGVIYSQRITDPDGLDGLTGAQAPGLHVRDGQWAQLIALNVAGAAQSSGLGDQLLDFMLNLCLVDETCGGVCAVTLCRDYDGEGGRTVAEYVAARDSTGAPVDPILRFHHLHGAEIVRPMPGYRPTDGRNQGHGVLIAYDLNELAARRREVAAAQGASSAALDADALRQALAHAIAATKPGGPPLDPDRAFVDQGWDSLDLMQLRAVLGGALGVTLDPTLFFRYPTPAAVAEHLNWAAEAGDPPPPPPTVSDEPVAIVGIACRFPGGVSGPEAFWNLLIGEVDAITPAPASRALAHPAAGQAIGFGGFLDDIDLFDAEFFGVSPREARSMDPQQRLLLELAWRALEDANLDPDTLAGGPTGVFIGAFTHDYETLQTRQGAEEVSAYLGSGASTAMLAGRLSYALGLRGPALTVNTACSSSLVALHLARRSLQSGECGLALVGGVSAILSPDLSIAFDKAGMLAPDGRCKSFDAAADGYVRSEGCAVVVLKPLSRAVADGDPIWAVVRGSATNQDGASNGLTAPSEDAQVAVIRAALGSAGLAPAEVGYVEAHGTGTPLGDPIEVRALERAYGRGREADAPLIVGSVKSNIGHTEAAAGLAGVIKVALALRHERIPPNLHFQKPNPQIRLADIPALVAERALPWPAVAEAPRRAGVSSFGFSGSNAHVILEAPPARPPRREAPDRDCHLLVLSARTQPALLQSAQRYLARLEDEADPIGDLCASAGAGRRRFRHRLAVIGDSREAFRGALLAFVEDREHPDLLVGEGSGSLVPGLTAGLPSADGARRLHATSSTFRGAFELSDGDHLARTQAGLRALWESWGVGADQATNLINAPVSEAVTGAVVWRDLMRSLGRLYVEGVAIDWRGVEADFDRRPVSLPGYPFERQSFWLDRVPVITPTAVRPGAAAIEVPGASVRGLVARILERDPTAIEPATPLIQYGLDSLMALELRRGLDAGFGVEIAVRTLMTEATLGSLEAALKPAAAVAPTPSPTASASPVPVRASWDSDPATLLSRLSDLGEHDLDELLRAAQAAV